MKKWLVCVFSPSMVLALQEKPWYGDFLEFHFYPLYNYNFFNKVNNASPPQRGMFFTNILSFGLDVTAPETWNFETELEIASTTSVSFGYCSFALQARKLWLDDVCGDILSLSTGFVYRDASNRMRKALSIPYHARTNFELHTAVGKEWSWGNFWTFRTYAVGALGQGTQGAPWLRGDVFLWWNFSYCHQFQAYTKSYWGLGSKTRVPLLHFDGWSHIGHQSIDIGGAYRYRLGIYGWFRFDYAYRVYARSYPENAHFFIFSLDFPFSIF